MYVAIQTVFSRSCSTRLIIVIDGIRASSSSGTCPVCKTNVLTAMYGTKLDHGFLAVGRARFSCTRHVYSQQHVTRSWKTLPLILARF